MTDEKTPLIETSALHQYVQGKDVVFIDARSGPDAFLRYEQGHVKGALHVDLDRDLSMKPVDAAQGGRHPLPDVNHFSSLLGKLGITPSTHVIVYDDKSGANAAARFWWMLKATGHKNIKVINGGLETLRKEAFLLTNEIPNTKEAPPYPFTEWKLPVVHIDAVEKAGADATSLIIDVREGFRYRGEREPIDLVAGHIPGAVNIPYMNNLDGDGKFLPASDLAEVYRKAIGNRELDNVIVHCGSGVTACHTLLALEYAGLSGAKLYVGSWSEWSRTNRPIAKGD
jgi:thiosulfate/3-mercaptopyruvate sulfurtransferase